MKIAYNFLLFITSIILPCVALFNKKIMVFTKGRKEVFLKISSLKNCDTIWFHASSLGEFEQAIPIIEELKKSYGQYKILVTFFSPSGYEIRKNYNLADVVCYLPLDSKKNAIKFIKEVNPKIAVFIKYEFWPNFLYELKSKNIPTILVSGIFRKGQIFFKWYGSFMRNSLGAFHHFFVQNTSSKQLLSSINYKNVTVAGDTRFDRVSKILNQDNSLNFITKFKNNNYTIVAGSTWFEDEVLLINYINTSTLKNEKIIIAPHKIKKESVLSLQKKITKNSVLFSDIKDKNLTKYQVLIVDTIGILTKLYSFADIAYVGGGLKTGLHNILEPAVFGIPIVIGDKYDKFKEALDLVRLKGCVSICNQKELNTAFVKFREDINYRKLTGKRNEKYIKENVGASKLIVNFMKFKNLA